MGKHILFVSNTCTNNEFKRIQEIKHSEKLNPSQKFYDMLIKGFSAEKECQIHCITARPIAHSNCDIKCLPYKEETVGERLKYIYIKTVNKPIIRNIVNIVQTYRCVNKIYKKSSREDDIVLICDPLAYDITLGAQLATVRKKIIKMAIVTDLPYYMTQINKSGTVRWLKKIISVLRRYIIEMLLNRFDLFCFLTESMNVINRKNRRYIVVEGMVPKAKDRIQYNNVENNIVVYAGGLFKQFGIDTLVEAATKIEKQGFELHLYGEGTSVEFINRTTAEYPHIKYKGVATLSEIYDIEKNAKILINPRPTNEEFTEYSFPSKTLEYLSAARPVLSTKLKGIPEEYFKYIKPITCESTQGIKQAIEECLSISHAELNKIGMEGYNYVQCYKNNEFQAKKILEFVFNYAPKTK